MRKGLLIAPLVLALVGCTTYINIPPQPGDLAVHDPNDDTVVAVEAAALGGVLTGSPLKHAAIVLPDGTSPESYRAVLKTLGSAARADGAAGVPVAHVRQVRVRGRLAEVDIVIPALPASAAAPAPATTPPELPPLQLVTSYLNWEPVAGWQSVRLRFWRVPVDDALLQSRTQTEEQKSGTPPPKPDEPAPLKPGESENVKPGNN